MVGSTPWGSEEPKCDKAVVSGCVRILPGRAGTKPFPASASPFGALVDMAGNVWESVSGSWAAHDAAAVTDPSVPGGGVGVIRGGSWDFAPASLKAFARLKFYATNVT